MSTLLVVVVALLTPIALDALWLRRTVLDTDAFVTHVGPLGQDPDIQRAIVDRVTASLVDVDVEARVARRLPDDLAFLAAPIASEVRTVVHESAERIVASDGFADLFERALRAAHAELVGALTGEGDRVTVDDGVVTIDLTDLRSQVVARVEGSRLGPFVALRADRPAVLQVTAGPAVARAQTAMGVLRALGLVIPVVLLVLAVSAVATAIDRRRGAARLGFAVAVVMAGHLLALALGRSLYLDAVRDRLDGAAAGAVYDLVVRLPRRGSWAVLAGAAIVWLGALLAGPSEAAVWARGALRHLRTRTAVLPAHRVGTGPG